MRRTRTEVEQLVRIRRPGRAVQYRSSEVTIPLSGRAVQYRSSEVRIRLSGRAVKYRSSEVRIRLSGRAIQEPDYKTENITSLVYVVKNV
jgi:hypothetical protein